MIGWHRKANMKSLGWGMWAHEKMVHITSSNNALEKNHYQMKSRIFNAFVVKQHIVGRGLQTFKHFLILKLLVPLIRANFF